MDEAAIEAAAELLADARLARGRFAGFPEALRPSDEAAAYRVQDRLHALLEERGEGPQAGHKIGCTTRVMQEYLGIRNPSAGGVLAGEVRTSGATVPTRGTSRLGVECEVAVRIGRDMAAASWTRTEAAAAVEACLASIEVVEDRYADYGALDAPTLIADDFFGAGIVLGEPMELDPLRLDRVAAAMSVDGAEVGAGVGADILGHPLEALAWLAGQRAARGVPIRAGEFVTLGSLVATNWVDAGVEVRVENDALGQVHVRFAAPA